MDPPTTTPNLTPSLLATRLRTLEHLLFALYHHTTLPQLRLDHLLSLSGGPARTSALAAPEEDRRMMRDAIVHAFGGEMAERFREEALRMLWIEREILGLERRKERLRGLGRGAREVLAFRRAQ